MTISAILPRAEPVGYDGKLRLLCRKVQGVTSGLERKQSIRASVGGERFQRFRKRGSLRLADRFEFESKFAFESRQLAFGTRLLDSLQSPQTTGERAGVRSECIPYCFGD
jgi:hypothetical protein